MTIVRRLFKSMSEPTNNNKRTKIRVKRLFD